MRRGAAFVRVSPRVAVFARMEGSRGLFSVAVFFSTACQQKKRGLRSVPAPAPYQPAWQAGESHLVRPHHRSGSSHIYEMFANVAAFIIWRRAFFFCWKKRDASLDVCVCVCVCVRVCAKQPPGWQSTLKPQKRILCATHTHTHTNTHTHTRRHIHTLYHVFLSLRFNPMSSLNRSPRWKVTS